MRLCPLAFKGDSVRASQEDAQTGLASSLAGGSKMEAASLAASLRAALCAVVGVSRSPQSCSYFARRLPRRSAPLRASAAGAATRTALRGFLDRAVWQGIVGDGIWSVTRRERPRLSDGRAHPAPGRGGVRHTTAGTRASQIT